MFMPVYSLANRETLEFVDCVTLPLTTDWDKPQSGTVVVRINSILFLNTGTSMRLAFQGRQASNISLAECWVGASTTSGSSASFVPSTKVQVTVNGNTNITIPGGDLVWTDPIAFDSTDVAGVTIAMDVVASNYPYTKGTYRNTQNVNEYIEGYVKNASTMFRKDNVTEADSDSKSGYKSSPDKSAIVTRVQVS